MTNKLKREWDAFCWLMPRVFIPAIIGTVFFITILLGAFAQGSIGGGLW